MKAKVIILARAGLFRCGGILAGTHAFGLYALELGVRLRDSLALTEDVDVAAARAVRIVTNEATSLSASLGGLGLRPVAGPGEPRPVRWETADGVVLDILAPRRRGAETIVRHAGLGVWAQAGALIEALVEARPYEVSSALADAQGRGPKWRAAIAASLSLRPDIATALDRL